jgi:hypothetical protein
VRSATTARMAALALWAALALGVLAQWLMAPGKPGTPWWHAIPGVQGLYGVAGCVAIVLASKWLGRHWLQRPDPDAAGDAGAGSPGGRPREAER